MQTLNEQISNAIFDAPGVEWDCSNYPHCKCNKQEQKCLNKAGVANEIEKLVLMEKIALVKIIHEFGGAEIILNSLTNQLNLIK